LLELDEDPELGDLNDRKILHTVNYHLPSAGKIVPLTIEVRFSDWEAEDPEKFERFGAMDAAITSVTITRFSRDQVLAEPVTEDSFVQGWRGVFFADYTIKFKENAAAVEETLSLNAAVLRFFSPNEGVKRAVIVADLISQILEGDSLGGISGKYQRKIIKVRESVEKARFALHQTRNLCEDYCKVVAVRVQDVAVCADVEVAADADIEWVLANIYNETELYFNPPIRFYTLREMEAGAYTPDEIFDGPPLENGFIKTEELEAAQLRSVLHLSDLINRYMDIPGVLAVKDVQITLYDDLGKPQLFTQPWTVAIPPGRLPRLYLETSRILFYKNGLPFLPRMEEMRAILAQLQGERERPKIPIAENDYPVPFGKWSDLADYMPVQHSFPLTYGIGPVGLSANAPKLRKAQATQLKAYLMPFEQIISNLLEQLAHTNELFSTDETLDRTYFGHYFDPTPAKPQIAGLANLYTPPVMTAADLQGLIEPKEVFHDRRNRFLDHMLARFGEQFRDYALMLYANSDRIELAPEKLILDKIRFLRFYPRVSAARAKAFNYNDKSRVCDYRNQAGLTERISRLLGMETIKSYFTVNVTADPDEFVATFEMRNDDASPVLLLKNDLPIIAASGEQAEEDAWELIGDVIANCTNLARYAGNLLKNEDSGIIAGLEPGILPADVIDFARKILEKERAYIVEHLLLRPKFPGDALMPVCLTDDCTFCGEEDPYSFRLTCVFQGRLEPFSLDIDLRRFADNTIRKETPSHLLPKICWIANDGSEPDPCAAIFGRIAKILQKYDKALSFEAACACAEAVQQGFDVLFQPWFEGKALVFHSEFTWNTLIKTLFASVAKTKFPCTAAIPDAAWAEIKAAVIAHFAGLAANGFQFDRFEKAWCEWLATNADFDWPVINDLLHRQVELLLTKFLPKNTDPAQKCLCADLLIGYFGNRFREWINARIEADLLPDAITEAAMETGVWEKFAADLKLILQYDSQFCVPAAIVNNAIFISALKKLLLKSYLNWTLVSHQLNVLIRIFSGLSNIYPSATLHDCDDGADDNPVRLNNTILGSM